MNGISKHSPNAYEGKMCRLIFSGIMEDIQQKVFEQVPELPETKDAKSLNYSTVQWTRKLLYTIIDYIDERHDELLSLTGAEKEWVWGEKEKEEE